MHKLEAKPMQLDHLVETNVAEGDAPASGVDGWDTIIGPVPAWVPLQLGELWAYRELLFFLIWRNIKIRYKQTVLGAAWTIVQPLMAMIVFSIFFGRLAGIPSEGVPYPVFTYAALVPWTFFANALTQASNSVVENERMITKIYFPRLLLPMASVLSGLLDLAIAFILLIGMLLWYGITPTVAIWTLPLFILIAVLAALGASLWLAALHVQYRDVRYVAAFLVQFWLFATPIAYPSSLVPEQWRTLYGLNPMVGVVEGFRWALLGQAPMPVALLTVSLLVTIGTLVGGLYYFRRMEDRFADIV
jgi:lipopolysaccharide transport system permease protein